MFRQRLELMREMYQNGAEMSPGSPDVNLEHANGSDPFYDRLVSRISRICRLLVPLI